MPLSVNTWLGYVLVFLHKCTLYFFWRLCQGMFSLLCKACKLKIIHLTRSKKITYVLAHINRSTCFRGSPLPNGEDREDHPTGYTWYAHNTSIYNYNTWAAHFQINECWGGAYLVCKHMLDDRMQSRHLGGNTRLHCSSSVSGGTYM